MSLRPPTLHPAHEHLLSQVPAELAQAWREAQDDWGRARAMLDVSNFYKESLKWKAVEAAELSVSYALRTDDRILTLKALLSLSFVLGDANRVMEALRHVQQALALADSLGAQGRPYVLEAMTVRGVIRSNIGDDARARRDYLYVLHHPQDALDQVTLLMARINLAWLYVDVDQPEVALHHLGLASETLQAITQQEGLEGQAAEDAAYYRLALLETLTTATLAQAEALRQRGRDQAMRDALNEVQQLLAQAWPLTRPNDFQPRMLLSAHQSALRRMQGDLAGAGVAAQEAVQLARQVGQNTYARPHLALAEWHAAQERWPEAITAYREALGIARRSGGHRMIQAVLGKLATIHEQQGDLRTALEVTREALRHAREVNRTLDDIQTLEDGVEAPPELGTQGLTWQERLRLAEEEARLDPLTGLLNRRGLEGALLRLPHDAYQPEALLVAMLDIDHFKSVNDQFSHTTGDNALRVVARLLADVLPSDALLARYGGEEFVLALPLTQSAAAHGLLEGCRLAVQRHDWSALLPGKPLSISIGYALGPGDAFRDILHQADEALYSAKQAGRNCVRAALP